MACKTEKLAPATLLHLICSDRLECEKKASSWIWIAIKIIASGQWKWISLVRVCIQIMPSNQIDEDDEEEE